MSTGLSDLGAAALGLTQSWCGIPSVRGDNDALLRQAAVLTDWLDRELRADIVSCKPDRGRPPVIHARLDVGAVRTVILYNMYDVMPADPAGWLVAPFEGGIRDLDGIGPCFVARGAENNKGPLAGMLSTLKAMADQGRLRVNVEILLDGEEECGSGALRDYLTAPDCSVRQGAGGLFPSFCEYGGGAPRLYLGFSGIAKGTVRVDSGSWGGPMTAIHSSNGPWIGNPARQLVRALSLLGERRTGRLGSVDLDEEARSLILALAREFDPDAELRFRRTLRYSIEGDATTLLSHVLSTASANLSSLATEPVGGDGVIPSVARAEFDVRCPPPLDPAEFLSAFRDDLEREMPGIATLRVADSYPGCRFDSRSAGVAALIHAYRETSTPPQIWPWAIGAAPGYAFADHAASFLIGGAGRGGNAHGVNEFMTLEGFDRFMRSIALWLDAMADAA